MHVLPGKCTVLHRAIQSVPNYPYFPVTTRIDGTLETTFITKFTQFPAHMRVIHCLKSDCGVHVPRDSK